MEVVHVSEALGGGLRTAIVNYIDATPEFEHTVIARLRPNQATQNFGSDTEVILYEGSKFGFMRFSRAQIQSRTPEVVHLHSTFAGLLRLFIGRKSHIGVTYSPHCYAMERTTDHKILRAFYWLLEIVTTRWWHTIIAVSPREKELAHRVNRRAGKVIVHNIAPATLSASSAAPDYSECSVAMLGRITAQKDPEFFAKVACLLRGRGLHFVWIGDGDDDGRRTLESCGVQVTGWVSPSRVADLLKHSQLYVHTARWEGAPLSTIEAAQMGCPVISRSIPSMESLGYVCEGATPDLIAGAITKFFQDDLYRDFVTDSTQLISKSCDSEQSGCSLREAYRLAACNIEQMSGA